MLSQREIMHEFETSDSTPFSPKLSLDDSDEECHILSHLESATVRSNSFSFSYSNGVLSPANDTADYSVIRFPAFKLCELDSDIIYYISEFVTRAEHFKIWNRINYRFYDLFSIERYFNVMLPLQSHLYQRDAIYFNEIIDKKYVRHNLDSTMIVVTSPQLSNDSRELEYRFMLKYYLIFYDKLLRLQHRYKREMMPHHQSFSHYQCNAIIHQCSNAFSAVKPTVRIGSRCFALHNDELQWVLSVLYYSGTDSPLANWDFSNCHLNDSQLLLISKAILSRQHFCTLQRIDISHNYDITDAAMPSFFAAMGENCPQIGDINMNETSVGDQTCAIVGAYFINYIDLRSQTAPNVMWLQSNVTANGENIFAQIVLPKAKSCH